MSAISRAAVVVVTVLVTLACAAPSPPTGLRVESGRLVDGAGNDLVLRGVNHPYTWYRDRPLPFADLSALGANAVRVVLSNGDRWPRVGPAEVAAITRECLRHRLVCVLEVHDTTGYGEQPGATTLARAVDYWIGLRDALAGTEPYVIVNVGNEPLGNVDDAPWAADATGAVSRLRAAGFRHALMLDGPGWGQDARFTMRDAAAGVLAADPDRNTVFSVHAYTVYSDAGRIDDYLEAYVRAGIPIVIGEFGPTHQHGDPDEDAIMAAARGLGVGYLGWSWSGNSGGDEPLDLVTDFDPGRLTDWGRRLFHGPDGIAETAREPTIAPP